MLTVTFEHELAANYSGFCPFKQLFFRLEKEERMAVLSLPVIPSDRGDDLHNLDMMEDSDLNLFMAGNQFMVMAELLAAFQRRYPRIRRIYYQTLPPGEGRWSIGSWRKNAPRQPPFSPWSITGRPPCAFKKKTVDLGPVWATEAQYARTTGLAFETVEPGADQDQREHIHYYICQLNNGPHQENAQRFLDFIQSKPAQEYTKSTDFCHISRKLGETKTRYILKPRFSAIFFGKSL